MEFESLDKSKLTPAMQQYATFRKNFPFPEFSILYQMGDFYETFFDDAERISKDLNILLTKRGKVDGENVPLAGFPLRQLNIYVKKLLEIGRKVVIVEQVQDSADAKGVVDRDITRVITPGTIFDENLLISDQDNFILAINTHSLRKDYSIDSSKKLGISWADLSSGAFYLSEMTPSEFFKEIVRITPAEILLSDNFRYDEENNEILDAITEIPDCAISISEKISYNSQQGRRKLINLFKVKDLQGFDCEDADVGLGAAGALITYFERTQRTKLTQLIGIKRVYPQKYMVLDAATLRCLEIIKNMVTGKKDNTLFGILDKTTTPMGARNLRQWLLSPLLNIDEINERLSSIEELIAESSIRDNLRDEFKNLGDLERLAGRLGTGRCNPRDYAILRNALRFMPTIKELTDVLQTSLIRIIDENISALHELRKYLDETLAETPPLTIKDGGIFIDGYSAELDELRKYATQGETFIEEFRKREAKRSKISTLKVGFNKIQGFYIEVTKANKDKIPDDYKAIQTLKNVERYTTVELKLYENKTLKAQKEVEELEYKMFQELKKFVEGWIPQILMSAKSIAVLDTLQSLAFVAQLNNYIRPQFSNPGSFHFRASRHPVVEQSLTEEEFVPNDCMLPDEKPIMILTGPNMSGKSTYIRQISLVTLMAQIGSFVPAKEAQLSICDRIFTRISTGDELARGLSTFMVEMSETANILNNATKNSLIVLDEVGRGTSTFDGMSIAWAIVEYIAEHISARTLFATHYHELPSLANIYKTIQCASVLVEEYKDEILFHHKIIDGSADKSYGIYVAQIAGMPARVVKRAKKILKNVEQKSLDQEGKPIFIPQMDGKKNFSQKSLFMSPSEQIVQRLKKIGLSKLSDSKLREILEELKDLADQSDLY